MKRKKLDQNVNLLGLMIIDEIINVKNAMKHLLNQQMIKLKSFQEHIKFAMVILNKKILQTGMNKKVIGMFKDELGGKIMKEFCALRAKTYAYLMDDDSEKKKAKGTKKCIIKRKIKFEDYKDSLFNNNTILRSQLRFKSDLHNMYTEQVNRIALNSNDDKRLQTHDRITTYPYETNAYKVCESEMMAMKKYSLQNIYILHVNNTNKHCNDKSR